MEEQKHNTTLGMKLEGNIICVACAKEQAERIPYTELFWASNKLGRFPIDTECAWCLQPLDSKRALDAADELISKYEPQPHHLL